MDDTIHNTDSVGSQSAVDAGSSLSCGAGKDLYVALGKT